MEKQYITGSLLNTIIFQGGEITYLKEHIPESDADLKEIILCIAEQGKRIRNGFMGRQGKADTTNIYGERQVEMDKWADEVLVDALSEIEAVASVASEERDRVISVNEDGGYSVVFDPLDGSSLMGINLSVGTIVGIYGGTDPLRPGTEMVGAAYIIYGPLTTLDYSVGQGVHEFVLDDEGRFRLQQENIIMGEGKIYSPGALRKKWLPAHTRFIKRLEEEGYKLRFAGAFVADVHQIIHKGGVFTYPAFQGKETGKLRLLFEAVPMGFIVNQAGGAVSDGINDIMTLEPDGIDQRIPVYIGGKKEIDMINEEMEGTK